MVPLKEENDGTYVWTAEIAVRSKTPYNPESGISEKKGWNRRKKGVTDLQTVEENGRSLQRGSDYSNQFRDKEGVGAGG